MTSLRIGCRHASGHAATRRVCRHRSRSCCGRHLRRHVVASVAARASSALGWRSARAARTSSASFSVRPVSWRPSASALASGQAFSACEPCHRFCSCAPLGSGGHRHSCAAVDCDGDGGWLPSGTPGRAGRSGLPCPPSDRSAHPRPRARPITPPGLSADYADYADSFVFLVFKKSICVIGVICGCPLLCNPPKSL